MTKANQAEEADQNAKIVDSAGRPISRSRRQFLSNAGMFSAGLVGSTLLAACSDDDFNLAEAQDDDDNGNNNLFNPAVSDAAVLQFALNLEYLEAEYYLRAVTGNGLSGDDNGGGGMSAGTVTGPRTSMVDFNGEGLIQRYAREIASDELDHVRFLRAGLGEARISSPAINLQGSFDAAATTALQLAGVLNDGSDGNPAQTAEFDPFASPLAFMIGAFIFEDVGVSAYQGGAQFIRNRDFLTAAAGILAVEGYHAGLVRTFLTARAEEGAQVTFQTSDGDRTLPLGAVVDAISDARDFVDGEADNDQGITQNTTVSLDDTNDLEATNIVPVDANGITFPRTPGQVHNVVYLTPQAADDGGFFPEGTRIPAAPGLTTSSDARMDDDGGTGGNSM